MRDGFENGHGKLNEIYGIGRFIMEVLYCGGRLERSFMELARVVLLVRMPLAVNKCTTVF